MTTLTMHQLGLIQAPKAMSNRVRPERRRSKAVPIVPDGVTAPKVGTVVSINLDFVVFEDEDGVQKTPMTKLRYSATAERWTQVSANLAGLLAFFDEEPPDDCKQVRIVRVIPSGRACYVVPA